MRRFLKSLVLASGVIAFAGTAMAADIVRPPAAKPVIVAPRGYSWVGHYIGVQGGWDWNTNAGVSDSGGIFGVFGGWNWSHVNNSIWGLDASFNWTGGFGSTWKSFIRGRWGHALDRTLIYVTAGGVGVGGTATSNWGWTAGVGVDQAFGDRHFLRLDYAYQSFGSSQTSNTFMVGLGMHF
jgi:outer membrane immunogenic protein